MFLVRSKHVDEYYSAVIQWTGGLLTRATILVVTIMVIKTLSRKLKWEKFLKNGKSQGFQRSVVI